MHNKVSSVRAVLSRYGIDTVTGSTALSPAGDGRLAGCFCAAAPVLSRCSSFRCATSAECVLSLSRLRSSVPVTGRYCLVRLVAHAPLIVVTVSEPGAMEMAEGSGVSIQLQYAAIPKMEGAEEYLKQRTIPDATFRNWNSYSAKVKFEKGVNVMEAFNLLPDPQTNGGLLFAAAPEAEEAIKDLLAKAGLQAHATPIGVCIERGEKTIVVS